MADRMPYSQLVEVVPGRTASTNGLTERETPSKSSILPSARRNTDYPHFIKYFVLQSMSYFPQRGAPDRKLGGFHSDRLLAQACVSSTLRNPGAEPLSCGAIHTVLPSRPPPPIWIPATANALAARCAIAPSAGSARINQEGSGSVVGACPIFRHLISPGILGLKWKTT